MMPVDYFTCTRSIMVLAGALNCLRMPNLKKLSLLAVMLAVILAIGVGLYNVLLPPAGERLAFSYGGKICVMNATGWHRRCLVEGRDPTWSPNGKRIAFEVFIPGGQNSNGHHTSSIYIINADGSDLVRLTDDTHYDECPAWSPDDERIAFSSTQIYIVNVDGSGLERLTLDDTHKYEPAWSPDGRQIAFTSTPGLGENLDIYIMNADGSDVRCLTEGSSDNACPDWSPDGQRIAFESARDGNWEIYVMNADGSDQTRLTNHPNVDRGPVWSPDGTQIAFLSSRSGRTARILYEGMTIQLQDIYVMNADGTKIRRLTYSPFGTYEDLDWSSQ